MFIDTQLRPQGEVKVDEVGRVLLEAAKLLECDGWCQRMFRDGDKYCIAEAISVAAGTQVRFERAYSKVARYLAIPPNQGLASWNDAVSRTLPEVLAALRGAAGL